MRRAITIKELIKYCMLEPLGTKHTRNVAPFVGTASRQASCSADRHLEQGIICLPIMAMWTTHSPTCGSHRRDSAVNHKLKNANATDTKDCGSSTVARSPIWNVACRVSSRGQVLQSSMLRQMKKACSNYGICGAGRGVRNECARLRKLLMHQDRLRVVPDHVVQCIVEHLCQK